MSRVRYIAMVPVAEGCPSQGCETCREPLEVEGRYHLPWRLYETADSARRMPVDPTIDVFAVNLDDLERVDPPESDEERYMRCERIGQTAWADVERLRPIVEPHTVRDAATLPVSHTRLTFVTTPKYATPIACVDVFAGGEWIEVARHVVPGNGQGTTPGYPVVTARPRTEGER